MHLDETIPDRKQQILLFPCCTQQKMLDADRHFVIPKYTEDRYFEIDPLIHTANT